MRIPIRKMDKLTIKEKTLELLSERIALVVHPGR